MFTRLRRTRVAYSTTLDMLKLTNLLRFDHYFVAYTQGGVLEASTLLSAAAAGGEEFQGSNLRL